MLIPGRDEFIFKFEENFIFHLKSMLDYFNENIEIPKELTEEENKIAIELKNSLNIVLQQSEEYFRYLKRTDYNLTNEEFFKLMNEK